ncbi:MAG TPA: tripartite tricarboxylate transporter substrate binding protein [Xanthobacteraceae bacterium]|nr:tripartite tricarboxylate transporter substrate binding protein [Xanthobacteraceae bacterium]
MRLLLRLSCAVAVSGLVAAAVSPARAEYPERAVRLLEPFPPGGAVDLVTRLVAADLAKTLGQPFLVESKPGAGGIIATEAVAKAAPDGYTLLVTTPNHTINAALNPKLPYDTEKDFAPIAVIAEVPEVLVSHVAAPFTNFSGFVDYARAHPGELNYASAGNGTLPHVSMELLLHRLGVKVTHIPYRGAAPAMADLLAGQVQLKMDTYATSAPHIAEGKLRALAIASRMRSPLAPDLPTVAELGVPGYEGILWIGVLAPAATPAPVIAKLAAACDRTVRSPELIERFRRDGIDPGGGTPSSFGVRITAEIAQWRTLVQSVKINAE